jgi:hypothetical protein
MRKHSPRMSSLIKNESWVNYKAIKSEINKKK